MCTKSWTRGVPFLILAVFLWIKRPGRVVHATGPDGKLRTQQSRASGAVYLLKYERFCDPYVSIRGPWRCPGVPEESLGCLRDIPGVPGACPGVPGACPGVPGASPGVSGACSGDPRGPRGLRGRPRHPRDPFHEDDSVI